MSSPFVTSGWNSELACGHYSGWSGFLAQRPPKKPGVALLASKRVHENYCRYDMFEDALFPGAMSQPAFAIRTINAHVNFPLLVLRDLN